MKRSHATPRSTSGSGSISKQTFVISLALVAVIGFVVGTRSDSVLAKIGSVFGFSVPHGQIDLSSVQATYRQLNANYDGKLDQQKLIDGANRGLVEAAGDKFTVYLDAKEAEEFEESLDGKVGGGVGVELTLRHDMPVVARVLPQNPAEAAGIEKDDVVTAVNGESTKGWDVEKTAAKVRGEVGTTVKISVLRDGETKDFSVTRAEVNNPSVTSRIENGVGILSITRFDEQTGDQARRAAEAFKSKGVRGVIVDLRDNGGGYVTASRDIASLWLDKKTVVTERKDGKVTDTINSGSDAILSGVPTIVLVNGNSASASEIVAGALRDHKAATLVGEKTYGKGTMQQMVQLGEGRVLKVTVAHWYTPSGRSLDDNGLVPDKKVKLTKADHDAGRDPQLKAALGEINR